MTARQRYVVEQQPAQGRQPGLWAIRDTETDELVQTPTVDGGQETELYAIRDTAESWISRNRYMEAYGRGRA